MALVKCPECGRERVSDSAEACPDCGYGIKVHFEKIKQEKIKAQKRIEMEELEKKKEEEAKKYEQRRIESVPKPEEPIFSRGLIIYIVMALIFFSWLMLYTPTTYGANPQMGEWILELLVFIGIPLFIYLPKYNKQVENYDLACRDFESYQRQVIREEDTAIASARAAAAVRAMEEAKKPECPYCHSHNTTKLTATAKAVDTAMFGVLGQKRRYQWHCNKCKSDF